VPNQNDLATALDTFLQRYAGYQLVQQTLLEACIHFAKADVEQKACVNDMLGMLPTLIRGSASFDYPPNLQPDTNNTPKQFSSFLSIQSPREVFFSYASPAEDDAPLPPLSVTCFGRFEVKCQSRSVTLCSNRSGRAILRYLVAKPGHCASSDTLQTLCWPEDEPEVAQRKLYIAISALRRSLHDGSPPDPRNSYILCKNGTYSLNAAVAVHTDVEEFLCHYQAGKQMSEDQEKQVACYEQACALYTGSFLPEDIYADWSSQQREQLAQTYLTMCGILTDHYLKVKRYEDAAQTAQAILKENRYDEAAHRQLIRTYAAQDRRSEAIQQYHRCVRLLREELNVRPLHETELLFQQLLTNESP